MNAVAAPEVRIAAEFPGKLDFLLGKRARYKVAYGGRGGAKSWAFARALLIEGLRGGLRVLCTRETQSSLKESVKQLLADQIDLLGLGAYYRVLDAEIRGPQGTLFIFKGLADPEALKSAEGVGRTWVEEARTITPASWKKLDFTMRKPGAEIWISFNPELESDFIYKHFVSGDPPPDAIVQKVSYRDNPWLDEAILRQIAHLKATNYDEYLWIIEGHCVQALDGAVYADELRQMTREGRVKPLPYIPGRPVQTFWDLGHSDHTAIWFAQAIGFNYHVIDYYENNRKLTDHYIQALQNRPYTYGIDWLPHDAASIHPGVERTVERQLKDAGRTVKIVPKVSLADGLNAVRTIFPVLLFDATRCQPGIERLRYYRYGVNEKNGRWTREPVHDTSSHAADALRYLGVALKGDDNKPKTPKPRVLNQRSGTTAWMAN